MGAYDGPYDLSSPNEHAERLPGVLGAPLYMGRHGPLWDVYYSYDTTEDEEVQELCVPSAAGV